MNNPELAKAKYHDVGYSPIHNDKVYLIAIYRPLFEGQMSSSSFHTFTWCTDAITIMERLLLKDIVSGYRIFITKDAADVFKATYIERSVPIEPSIESTDKKLYFQQAKDLITFCTNYCISPAEPHKEQLFREIVAEINKQLNGHIFITEDGVPIYQNDKYYQVNTVERITTFANGKVRKRLPYTTILGPTINPYAHKQSGDIKYYSTYEAAANACKDYWALQNKTQPPVNDKDWWITETELTEQAQQNWDAIQAKAAKWAENQLRELYNLPLSYDRFHRPQWFTQRQKFINEYIGKCLRKVVVHINQSHILSEAQELLISQGQDQGRVERPLDREEQGKVQGMQLPYIKTICMCERNLGFCDEGPDCKYNTLMEQPTEDFRTTFTDCICGGIIGKCNGDGNGKCILRNR